MNSKNRILCTFFINKIKESKIKVFLGSILVSLIPSLQSKKLNAQNIRKYEYA